MNENPVISEVVFEGNKVVSSEELSASIRSSASNAYSKETVVADAKSLAELYKSKGRFNAVITPQYINSEKYIISLKFISILSFIFVSLLYIPCLLGSSITYSYLYYYKLRINWP